MLVCWGSHLQQQPTIRHGWPSHIKLRQKMHSITISLIALLSLANSYISCLYIKPKAFLNSLFNQTLASLFPSANFFLSVLLLFPAHNLLRFILQNMSMCNMLKIVFVSIMKTIFFQCCGVNT